MSHQHDTKDWMAAVAAHLNLSLSELAIRAGLAPSTVTRFVYDKTGQLGISQRTVDAIAAYSGIPKHVMPGQRRIPGLSEPDAVPYTAEGALGMPAWVRAAIDAARGNRNGVEPWVMKGRALDMLGILPGDIVIIDQNKRPRAGDVVCAQITDFSSGGVETVFRRFDPPYLVSHSAKLGPQKPELVDDDRVIIMGVEAGVIRAAQ